MRPDLLRWQWEGYSEFHRSRINLWIHPPAVSLFIAGAVLLVVGAVTVDARLALEALAGMIVGFALQGVGHKREATPPIPFAGPVDVITRIFAEQFITFPRFLVSGGWWSAMKKAV
jgi:membrane-bound ClpP family serine protease